MSAVIFNIKNKVVFEDLSELCFKNDEDYVFRFTPKQWEKLKKITNERHNRIH